jgi:hypothetical protein
MTSKWSRRCVDSISSPFFTSASKNKKQLFKTFNFSRRKKILLSIYGRKKIIRNYSFISRNPMHFIFWSFFPCIVIAPPQVFVHLIYRLNLFLNKSPCFCKSWKFFKFHFFFEKEILVTSKSIVAIQIVTFNFQLFSPNIKTKSFSAARQQICYHYY